MPDGWEAQYRLNPLVDDADDDADEDGFPPVPRNAMVAVAARRGINNKLFAGGNNSRDMSRQSRYPILHGNHEKAPLSPFEASHSHLPEQLQALHQAEC